MKASDGWLHYWSNVYLLHVSRQAGHNTMLQPQGPVNVNTAARSDQHNQYGERKTAAPTGSEETAARGLSQTGVTFDPGSLNWLIQTTLLYIKQERTFSKRELTDRMPLLTESRRCRVEAKGTESSLE